MEANQTASLIDLLTTHAPQLQALLPSHLWPVQPVQVEQYGPLTKYTLGPDGDEWLHLHYVNQPDTGAPHCHPCRIVSYRLKGWYRERLFADGTTQDVLREEGSTHVIEPECIHLLTALAPGGVWTLVRTGPVVRAWQHYPELL